MDGGPVFTFNGMLMKQRYHFLGINHYIEAEAARMKLVDT